MSVWNFSSTMRPYLEELAQRSEESVYLGVLENIGSVITYVDAIESPKAVRFTVPVGAARPLYSTAAGRVLLAFGDQEWVENYLRNTKIMAYTPHTIAFPQGTTRGTRNDSPYAASRSAWARPSRVGRDRSTDFRRRWQADRSDRDRRAGQPARASTRRVRPIIADNREPCLGLDAQHVARGARGGGASVEASAGCS